MGAIKLLTWNIWYEEKLKNILSVLKEANADIVCLQELTVDTKFNPGVDISKQIAKQLNYNYYFEPTMVKGTDDIGYKFGNGIFSKFLVANKHHILIQQADPDQQSYETEDRAYIEVQLDVDGKNLDVGTTHLSYSDQFAMTDKRLDEAKKLYEAIGGHDENFIFMGDMNAQPGSEIIKKMSSMLVSVGPVMNEPTWTTKPFSYREFEASTLDWRLDYIFATKDIKVLSSKTIKTKFSDHLPILAEVEI